jgi:hypothetical protein
MGFRPLKTVISSTEYFNLLYVDVCPVKVDWKILAEDIKATGIPFWKQAHAIGCEWSTMQKWLKGSTPLFHTGHAFLILHSKQCGMEWTETRLKEFYDKTHAWNKSI